MCIYIYTLFICLCCFAMFIDRTAECSQTSRNNNNTKQPIDKSMQNKTHKKQERKQTKYNKKQKNKKKIKYIYI